MANVSFPRRIVIMGAAGRDFHNFNVVYRDDPDCEVIAFTAAQTPGITGRRYPAALAGPHYPDGIAIIPEDLLARLCRERSVDEVVFAYSDVAHADVMHRASVALAGGASFTLLGPRRTMLKARRPVIAVSAVRTGCGKSQLARWLSQWLRKRGLNVGVLHHPMPYGDLGSQIVQRFARLEDLDIGRCSVEERQDYEPHIRVGNTVYTGVDFGCVLPLAEADSDVLLWEGANNDVPFVEPDLHIVLVDPLRPGDTATYYPGEAVLRMADVIIVAKANAAPQADIAAVINVARKANQGAPILRAASNITLEQPELVHGRRVLVVEDGLSLTLGGLATGAGYAAARQALAADIVDPRPFAVGTLSDVFTAFPHLGPVLPALGYSPEQLKDVELSINRSDAEVVLMAVAADLSKLIKTAIPTLQVRYEFAECDDQVSNLLLDFVGRIPARAW